MPQSTVTVTETLSPMKLVAAYLPCDKAAVFMDAIKWTYCRSGLYAAGAVELVGQLRNHILQRLGLVCWGHLRGTKYGFFVLQELRITLFRLEWLTVSELVKIFPASCGVQNHSAVHTNVVSVREHMVLPL